MNIKSDNPISIKPLVNIGALFDIPTGTFITGKKGEMILNGGLASVTGMVGTGNMFKSTISHYFMLQSANRLKNSIGEVPLHTYDTEDNMIFNLERLNKLTSKLEYMVDEPLYDDNIWSVISKSEMTAEKWITKVHENVLNKLKDKKNVLKYDGYINRLTNGDLVNKKPSFIEIDSFSELESGKGAEIVSDGKIQDSNTIFMHEGLFKTKIIKDLPRLANSTNTSFLLTAHVGDEINMASGPFAPQPTKSLQHMRTGQKIKGIAGKIYFLSTHMYHAFSSTILKNPTTKMPEYPLDKEDNATDLNLVKLKQLRNKTGPSGYILELVISQVEGVLPTLTEFHHIKTNKFGLVGNDRSYSIAIYPDIKLSRTTVRSKIDTDAKLRRAINIISELLQMKTFMRQYSRFYIEPEELYNKVIEAGYSWDYILEHTRSWYTPKQYDVDLKPCSILDILQIATTGKQMYWVKEMKKQMEDKK